LFIVAIFLIDTHAAHIVQQLQWRFWNTLKDFLWKHLYIFL